MEDEFQHCQMQRAKHRGKNTLLSNDISDYILDNTVIRHTVSERDLNVHVSSDLKPTNHCIIARNGANSDF